MIVENIMWYLNNIDYDSEYIEIKTTTNTIKITTEEFQFNINGRDGFCFLINGDNRSKCIDLTLYRKVKNWVVNYYTNHYVF